MGSKYNIGAIRKAQTVVSILCFIAAFFVCWYVTGFNIQEIPLSKLGVNHIIKNIWNSAVILISVSMFINTHAYIKSHIVESKRFLTSFFMTICLLLAGTAIVTMEQCNPLHSSMAVFYFLFFPLFIFLLSFLNRKHILISERKIHMTVSILMVIIPLICLYLFKGLAIGELSHTCIVLYWNIFIMRYYNT